MTIPKELIVAELRRRGQHMRAEFVDRQLPDEVDPNKHGGLLATLNVDLAELVAASERTRKDAETA
jgi:hypothetical protein